MLLILQKFFKFGGYAPSTVFNSLSYLLVNYVWQNYFLYTNSFVHITFLSICVCRKPSGVLPVPITTIRHPGSHVIENSCTSRFIATPSRVLHTALPTPKNKATSTVNVPVKDSFLIPRIPERVALVHSQSRSRRTLLHESKPGI